MTTLFEKRHFQWLTQFARNYLTRELTIHLADQLETTSPRFDRDKFLTASMRDADERKPKMTLNKQLLYNQTVIMRTLVQMVTTLQDLRDSPHTPAFANALDAAADESIDLLSQHIAA